MPVPTSIADLSTTAASNFPAGSDVPSALDDTQRALGAIVKQNVSKGIDIASAGTITIPNAGGYFVVTGTTTINTINDSWNGREVTLKFSGILTLTHSANLILPGAANVTTAAGVVAKVTNESTGVWRCTGLTGILDGTVLTDADIGVTVQAYDAQLADIAGLTPTDNAVVIGNGTNFVAESGATLKTSLGLTIGTDVQAFAAAASQVEMEAGTEAGLRTVSPLRVAQAIAALGAGSTLGTPLSPTGTTTAEFSSLPAGIKWLNFTLSRVTAGALGATFALTIGDSGGLETTGYLSTLVELDASPTLSSSTTAIPVGVQGNDDADNLSGTIYFTLVDSSTNTWSITGQTTGNDGAEIYQICSSKSLSATLDRIRLTASSNYDGGKVNILYGT